MINNFSLVEKYTEMCPGVHQENISMYAIRDGFYIAGNRPLIMMELFKERFLYAVYSYENDECYTVFNLKSIFSAN